VDLYFRVRLACHVEGLSERNAASRFGIARETVRKMLRHSEPPGSFEVRMQREGQVSRKYYVFGVV
jgi:transposase